MTPPARLILDRDFVIGRTDPRLFGSFVEHLGRAVYTGIYEPGHATADAHGFRRDVLDLVRELAVTVVRYPGGNFVSGYKWEDGVGPREHRPRRRDLAWTATETNEIGTNEFIDWCRLAEVEPMLAVNLGTRGPAEAGEFFEYVNHPGGTALSDLRRAHGWEQPHNVRLWCLGNEMDGPWQMGAKNARDYGKAAREAAKLMRGPDANRTTTALPRYEFVACGSSHWRMPTFGTWEREMLEECYEHVDFVSLHTYYDAPLDRAAEVLARPDAMSRFVDEVVATCDAVAAARKITRRLDLSFDEWNVWAHEAGREHWNEAWSVAPRQLEQVYTLLDALVMGGMALTLLAHADRVKIGCLAQLVNVIAPIMTRPGGPAWRQTLFWPFHDFSRFGRGEVLRPVSEVPTYAYREPNGVEHTAPAVQAVAVANDAGGVSLFAINRRLETVQPLRVELRSFPTLAVQEWRVLRHDDLGATNTEEAPDRVAPVTATGARLEGGALTADLPPASWNVLRLAPA
jgi:alpha-N-arabinofuranosidase